MGFYEYEPFTYYIDKVDGYSVSYQIFKYPGRKTFWTCFQCEIDLRDEFSDIPNKEKEYNWVKKHLFGDDMYERLVEMYEENQKHREEVSLKQEKIIMNIFNILQKKINLPYGATHLYHKDRIFSRVPKESYIVFWEEEKIQKKYDSLF